MLRLKIPRHDIRIVTGDLNAKIGEHNKGWERIMGKHAVGCWNENGENFEQLYQLNNLVIGGLMLPHKEIDKTI